MKEYTHSDMLWAIKGSFGFYYAVHRTRTEAIKDHVQALFTYPTSPNKAQRKYYWQRCYRRGDRVVKVRIVEIERRGAAV